jgi:cation transport ATPase
MRASVQRVVPGKINRHHIFHLRISSFRLVSLLLLPRCEGNCGSHLPSRYPAIQYRLYQPIKSHKMHGSLLTAAMIICFIVRGYGVWRPQITLLVAGTQVTHTTLLLSRTTMAVSLIATNLATLAIGSLFYGSYLVLFFISLYLLLRRYDTTHTSHKSRQNSSVFTSTVFVSAICLFLVVTAVRKVVHFLQRIRV